jgi:integrase
MRGGMQVKDLRAAHASLLAAIGASPPEAQQQLGHALGTLTTMRHYSRVLEVRELQEVGSRPGMSGMLDRLEAAEEVVDSGR